MPTAQRKIKRRETLNLRIKPEVRELIDRAARLTGRNRTEFVVTAAQQSAEEALIDRKVFLVDERTYNAFLKRLDAPPAPNERLLRTLKTSPPWKR
jgi:uncharacterized protein (DUF1778 family)